MKYFTHKKRRFRKRKSIKRLSRRKKARMTKKKIVGGSSQEEKELIVNLFSLDLKDVLEKTIVGLKNNKGKYGDYGLIGKYYYKVEDMTHRDSWWLYGKLTPGSSTEYKLYHRIDTERFVRDVTNRYDLIRELNGIVAGNPEKAISFIEMDTLPDSMKYDYKDSPQGRRMYIRKTNEDRHREEQAILESKKYRSEQEKNRLVNGPLSINEFERLSQEEKDHFEFFHNQISGDKGYLRLSPEKYEEKLIAQKASLEREELAKQKTAKWNIERKVNGPLYEDEFKKLEPTDQGNWTRVNEGQYDEDVHYYRMTNEQKTAWEQKEIRRNKILKIFQIRKNLTIPDGPLNYSEFMRLSSEEKKQFIRRDRNPTEVDKHGGLYYRMILDDFPEDPFPGKDYVIAPYNILISRWNQDDCNDFNPQMVYNKLFLPGEQLALTERIDMDNKVGHKLDENEKEKILSKINFVLVRGNKTYTFDELLDKYHHCGLVRGSIERLQFLNDFIRDK